GGDGPPAGLLARGQLVDEVAEGDVAVTDARDGERRRVALVLDQDRAPGRRRRQRPGREEQSDSEGNPSRTSIPRETCHKLKGANIDVAALGREGWEDRLHGLLLPLSRRSSSAGRARS